MACWICAIYSWDATFAAAAGESEELAYRLNKIYNEQCEDCTMTSAGMTCELPYNLYTRDRYIQESSPQDDL